MSQKTVTMVLPNKVDLHDDKHVRHSFGPGICEIPEKFGDHWYLKANGAKKYDAKAEAAKLLQEAEEKKHEAAIKEAEGELAAAKESGKEADVKKAQAKLDKLLSKSE